MYSPHKCAHFADYAAGMENKTTLALANNVRRLMDDKEWSQRALAKRAGVSQRAVGYILNYRDVNDRHATLETIEAIASAFGVAAWQLLVPGLELDLLRGQRPARLLNAFNRCDDEVRAIIENNIAAHNVTPITNVAHKLQAVPTLHPVQMDVLQWVLELLETQPGKGTPAQRAKLGLAFYEMATNGGSKPSKATVVQMFKAMA